MLTTPFKRRATSYFCQSISPYVKTINVTPCPVKWRGRWTGHLPNPGRFDWVMGEAAEPGSETRAPLRFLLDDPHRAQLLSVSAGWSRIIATAQRGRPDTCSRAQSSGGGSCSHLQLGAGVQYDVLGGVLDVLCPRSQPCDSVVCAHLFPLVASWGLGDPGIPAAEQGWLQFQVLDPQIQATQGNFPTCDLQPHSYAGMASSSKLLRPKQRPTYM